MKVIESEEITKRDYFPLLCNKRGIIEAMEIGVDSGNYAKKFMQQFDGIMLWLIDPYLPYDEMPGLRTADMMMAVQAMAPYHGSVKFFMLRSVEAAEQLPSWIRPKFIYIDGDHSYDAVRMDIDAWWDRLPEDGILAGHDYQESHQGVVQAVNEFAEHYNLTVRLTKGDEPSPVSWYVYKTEPKSFEFIA